MPWISLPWNVLLFEDKNCHIIRERIHNFNCPVEAAMDVVGGKYKAIIIYHLIDATLRLSQLQKEIPQATPKMLSQQLKEFGGRRNHQPGALSCRPAQNGAFSYWVRKNSGSDCSIALWLGRKLFQAARCSKSVWGKWGVRCVSPWGCIEPSIAKTTQLFRDRIFWNQA